MRDSGEVRPLRDAVLVAALFSGVVIVNGILAIAFIALMQALGLWGPLTTEAGSPDDVRSSLQAFVQRSSAAID